jgi:hypothetical protein
MRSAPSEHAAKLGRITAAPGKWDAFLHFPVNTLARAAFAPRGAHPGSRAEMLR